ncbi:hypothetical protein BVC80_243g41 [Macleaya cordata]|uniref:Endonuclease/exonuclease/phosphatase n=1 Tax=Macleaya cordata TaxID=56857 RepID=A0A200R183_MACCD|nr:hypothetical protein BVC80_243g41 [Macleaya cordata]
MKKAARVVEPMINYSQSVCDQLHLRGISRNAIHNDGPNRKGNIWLMWKSSLTSPSVISSSSQAITVEAELKIIACMNKSWLAIGDFNCVLRIDEKKGGLAPKASAMNDFWDCLHDCNLLESKSSGLKYSWCNN